jgi:hypothetical protein
MLVTVMIARRFCIIVLQSIYRLYTVHQVCSDIHLRACGRFLLVDCNPDNWYFEGDCHLPSQEDPPISAPSVFRARTNEHELRGKSYLLNVLTAK